MLDTSISLSTEALMAELQFSRKELEDLARKVGTLQPFLSDKERALLLAIFASAEHHVRVTEPGHGAFAEVNVLGQELAEEEYSTLGDLMRQLLNSYIPGNQQPESGTSLGLTGKVTGMPQPDS
jgi:hypothetical protein